MHPPGKGRYENITASITSRRSCILIFIDVNTLSGTGDTKINEHDSVPSLCHGCDSKSRLLW